MFDVSGRWQVAGGRWQVAGGRWQVAGGRGISNKSKGMLPRIFALAVSLVSSQRIILRASFPV
ncbi:MAG: hypothetical protein ACI93R_002866 [Flavobacteriales bacterium]|jgi:hypothetical protein